MSLLKRFTSDLSSRRAQHLVYLLHIWLCVPFLFFWVVDARTKALMREPIISELRILVVVMLAYMALRTWIAYVDPPKLKWWFVFPPIDVALITLILITTQRGPMSNITLLYFLPMVQASGTLNVRWSAAVGLLVVLGTALATVWADPNAVLAAPTSIRSMLHDDPLNVAFRVFFLLIISSLMAYQALIAAGYRERLGVEADRNRIAMDMHDGVQGHLITIASQLELILHVAEKDPKRAVAIAKEGREGTRQAADELRFLVQRLRTPTLASGFVPALRQYAHNICDRNGLRLVFEAEGPEATLSTDIENAMFRIAQEALTNIVKHANARSVSITVEILDTNARLVVGDDGDGFDDTAKSDGIGLESMRVRVEANRGELQVNTSPNCGTSIEAKFMVGAKNG